MKNLLIQYFTNHFNFFFSNLASISAFASGTLWAFASPAIPKLISEYGFTIEEVSYIAVIGPASLVISTPIFCKLADKIGRKYTLFSAGIIYVAAWLSVAFASNIWVFYLSRVLYGVGDASVYAILPAYIAEITSARMRNLYGNTLMIFSFHGQFFSNCIGYYFSIPTTGFIMLTFPILYLICFSFMPDTPYFLIMAKNTDGARKSLQKLRGIDNVDLELKQITQDVNRQLSESVTFKDLWTINSNRKALFIALFSRIAYQLSGFIPLVAYSQYVFQEAGGVVPNGVASMIVSGIICVGIIFANLISDQLGRKKSMIISCSGCGIALLGESIYFYLQKYELVDLTSISWFPVAALVLYALAFCVGLGIVPTLIAGEIFSTSIRKHATSVTNVVFGIFSTTFAEVFQLLMTAYGLWAPFLFFSICLLVNAFAAYFIIIETKGKTLEDIQQMLKRNKK